MTIGLQPSPSPVPVPAEPQDEDCDDFAKGSIIAGKYVVERTLGTGGLAVVVLARDRVRNQLVAIKYLKSAFRWGPTLVKRFLREARLAAKIRSEHVVKVHDVGVSEQTGPFIVMEYLEGIDLRRALEAGSLPIAQAVDYVVQACEALAEANALGIVHRDLKPANLFLAHRLNQPPIIKLIDFGIATVMPTHRDGTWSRLTRDNEYSGTPPYMSPEQLRGPGDVDGRSDVWSLGVVLYELVTGELPFRGESVPLLFVSILRDPPLPPPTKLPQALRAAIWKCLEKDTSRRFRDVMELAQELAPLGPAEMVDGDVARGDGRAATRTLQSATRRLAALLGGASSWFP